MPKANQFKIKFNPKAFEQIRNLPEVRADLQRRARNIAEAASENGRVDGYQVTELVLEESRGAVSVMATDHAHNHNRKTHALLKALDAGKE